MEQITLNMIPKGITPICHASQYDKGRVIRLNIMDGLQGYVLSNESVQLNVRKPDMNIVTTDVDTTSGNTFVDIVTTEQMTACEGDNLCEIVLSAGDVVIASLNFIMRVEVDVLKDGIESETEIHNLTTQIQAINDEIVPQMVADEVENQYDSENVIFDSTPTAGHGNGYAVTSEGVKNALDEKPDDLSDLGDVEISSPTSNQALVYDPETGKWVNGEVSTVGSIDDLDDVDTTGKSEGDNLRYDGSEWVAKPNTVTMTLAEWNAMSTAEQTAWLNSHKKTRLIFSDAPNLNETAKQISYDGGTDTVWDKVEGKASNTQSATLTPESGVQVMHISSGYTDKQGCISAEIRFTGSANAWKTLGTLSIKPNDACQVIGMNTGTGAPIGIVRLRDTGVVEVYPTSAISNAAVGFSISFVMA